MSLFALICPSRSHAQAALDRPFSPGFALSPIEPAPAGDRFFLVPDGWSDPSAPEDAPSFRGMVFAHLTLKPTLIRTDNTTGAKREIVKRQLFVHADATYYAYDWLLLNADLPVAVLQQGDGPVAPGTALGDLRLGGRVGLVGDASSKLSLGPALDIWLPTGSTKNLTSDGKLRANPKIDLSGKLSVLVYAASIGYLSRRKMDAISWEVGPAFTFGAAVGLSLFDDVVQVGPELSGDTLLSAKRGSAFGSRTTALSALFGARVHVGDFVFGAGYGPGLSKRPGVAPRVYLSAAFSPKTEFHEEGRTDITVVGEGDRDSDGISDDKDGCPDQPGPPRPEKERNGCPEGKTAPVQPASAEKFDSDGDGIPDSEDACPKQPGERSSDRARNGCGVSDQDGDGVPDSEDACPMSKGERSSDPNNNGCLPDRDRDGVPDAEDACPDKPGAVTGVKATNGCPGANAEPAKAGPKEPLATFIGYDELDGAVQIYVELTQEVPIEVKRTGRRFECSMRGARVKFKNNRNPLLLTHFKSSVSRAFLVQAGKDA
ncbi:MAG TPA: thrombospondin type 3 repeat-containing protein, partial [Polyangiaceae bacterium]